jgi:dihydrofolate synthase / folylpolyglutamate synthase
MLPLGMPRRFGDLDELYSRLLESVNVERGQRTELKLDRMLGLCSALGDPQSACPAIHVAGSKGKGSVSIMIARTLEAAGFRTGLYTSPHFIAWKERISLAGDEMPDGLLLDAAEEVFAAVESCEAGGPGGEAGGEAPTFFELTTLIAFCAFRAAGCERVVLETGLGGRLDSTNVVDPVASVITPIELEHTEWLGDSIESIAFEKAGIVKPGRPCYLGRLRPEARVVLAGAARERGSPLRDAASLVGISEVEVAPAGTSAMLSFSALSSLAERFPAGLRVSTPLVGAIQAENMALAFLAAAESEPRVGPDAAAGLRRSFLPARFQVLPLVPPVVLDGAHTPDSVAIALDSFRRLFPGGGALLFGCAEDKKHGRMAEVLAPAFDRITLTRPGAFKASDLGAVEASFRDAGAEPRADPDFASAIGRARSEAAALGVPLLVTGSFYLCAEALKTLSAK